MIKKFFTWGWSMRKQFAQYFVVGLSATILDMCSLYLLKEFFNLRPVFSVVVNQIFILCYVFSLNKFWVFRATGQTHRQVSRFLKLFIFNYAFSVGWMFLWNEHLGYNYLLTRVANIVFAVSWNFLFYKYWVYKVEEIKMANVSQVTDL